MPTLDEIYADDPALLEHYMQMLLKPGWAGELQPYELAYIKSELHKSPSTKRRLGFKPSAKRFSESRIRHVAMHGLDKKR